MEFVKILTDMAGRLRMINFVKNTYLKNMPLKFFRKVRGGVGKL